MKKHTKPAARSSTAHLVTGIAGFICVVALLAMYGWVADIQTFKSIVSTYPSMKFITAAAFLLCGLMLYSIRWGKREFLDSDFLLLLGSLLALTLLVSALFVASIFGHKSGLEDLFLVHGSAFTMTEPQGAFSRGTIICFVSIVLAGIGLLSQIRYRFLLLSAAGTFVAVIGCRAIAGYLFSVPDWYFASDPFYAGMALHTAVLFVLMGISFLHLGIEEHDPHRS